MIDTKRMLADAERAEKSLSSTTTIGGQWEVEHDGASISVIAIKAWNASPIDSDLAICFFDPARKYRKENAQFLADARNLNVPALIADLREAVAEVERQDKLISFANRFIETIGDKECMKAWYKMREQKAEDNHD